MKLAKNHIDLGLFSNLREEQLAFWQHEVGLSYDHMGSWVAACSSIATT